MESFEKRLARVPDRKQIALAPPPIVKSPKRRARRTRIPLGIVVPLSVFVSWYALSEYGIAPKQILPAPQDVWARALEMINSGELPKHIIASLTRLVLGLSIGGILGIATGVLVGMSVLLERLFGPLLRFLTPVPVLAWMPILVLLFGIGEIPKIALMAIGAFFVLFTSAYAATRSLNATYLDVAKMFGKSRVQILTGVILPGSLPSIIEGLRAALALSWVILVAAEMIVSTDGLGWLLWDARTFGRTTDAYVATISVGILGLMGDLLLQWIRYQLIDWKKEFQGF
jgi:sulfonate transport system permease protein